MREKRRRSADVPVTGLDTTPSRPDAVLVTTRDSRIRMYQGTSAQAVKFKGHRNRLSRVAATFSPDGMYVICGSDDGGARPLLAHQRLTRVQAALRSRPHGGQA